jgi:hypothetical protein
MDQSKKEFLTVEQGVKLSKSQNSTTAEEIEWMKVIPYASVIRFYKVCYAVYLAIYLAKSDLGVDH